MANKPRNKNYGDWLNLVQTRQKFNPTHEEGSFAWKNLPSGFVLTAYSETVDLVALRMTLRSVLGPHKIVLESLVLTGASLHSGLIAPPTASQTYIPGGASEKVNIWWDTRGGNV